MPGASDPDEIICVCRGITRGQIQAGIELHGCKNLAALASTVGAGAACGSCSPTLREMLGDDTAWTEVTASTRVLSADAADAQRIEQIDLQLPEGALYPEAAAGQHVTVQGLIDGRWVSRNYTVINPGTQTGVVSIAVRRVPGGQLTPWLLKADITHQRLRISAPRGEHFWAHSSPQTVCMVGGIGVTMARSLLAQCPPEAGFHLDYSARSRADQVFREAHEALVQQRPGFTMTCRTDDVDGYITQKDVAATVARFPDARYVLCGPPPYVSAVSDWLQKSGIHSSRIHIEKFFLPVTKPPVRRSWKTYGYKVGAILALLPALWLLPGLAHMVPHHDHNPGHENLECSDCHRSAPGTLRQQLQAKVDHWLGRREVDTAFVFKAVNNPVCLDCHKRSDDYHPTHRFLEPRFAEVRTTLGPQLCISCHREHEKVRLTQTNMGFCAACHGELALKKDPIEPTHADLIKTQRWNTCLGCHDFHNNHGWKAPEKFSEAISPERVQHYFSTGPSPYGEVKERAETKLPVPGQKH